ncbi:MAG: alpha/beta hydrolase [Proteobacteria bacterium]|nr:alpha/beta hydrolase [Pseudomonadota bacterium]
MNKSQTHVVIVHGTMGSAKENWFPWLSKELEALGAKVSIPQLPTPKDQNLFNWIAEFEKAIGPLTANHILLGHCVGATFCLRMLERLSSPIKATFLVSTLLKELVVPGYKQYIESFIEEPFNWAKIERNAGKVGVFHGADDPYIPLHEARQLAQDLHTSLHIIEEGGHLNASSGFTEFPLLLEMMAKSI